MWFNKHNKNKEKKKIENWEVIALVTWNYCLSI